MAKAVAKVEEAQLPAVNENYDYGEYAGAGGDQIDNADVSIPRLKMIQQMSPEAKGDNPVAKEGDMLHSITGEVLVPKGQKLKFIPIFYQKEYILWRDRKNGGGIMARARRVMMDEGVKYAWDKPNEEFEDKIEGKFAVKYKTGQYIEDDGLAEWGSQLPSDPDSGPAATETHNYIVALPDHGCQLIAITLARTAAKKAKDLNFMIKTATQAKTPLFALVFSVGAVIESSDDNTWANYAFQAAGKVSPMDPSFRMLADVFKGFASKSFVIHDEEADQGIEKGTAAPKDGKF